MARARRHYRPVLRRGPNNGSDEGASAVEYALIVVSIAAVIVLIVVALGAVVNKSMKTSCDTIKTTLNAAQSKCAP
jgi:Flp pilus assembly pilin Flp